MKQKKKFIVWMFALCMAISSSIASEVQQPKQSDSYISKYMELYDYSLSEKALAQLQIPFFWQNIECEDITVGMKEILYDGQWLYTAAAVQPKDTRKTLIMPGSAEMGDKVAGDNGEGIRINYRTYKQIAEEEGKQLLSVYVYIKEFDSLGAYFLDHFQIENEMSVLLSGARLAGGDVTVQVHWVIQVYQVDLVTGKYTMQQEVEYPIIVKPAQPYIEKTYQVIEGDSSLFNNVVMAKTVLGTYVVPQWKTMQDKSCNYVILVDRNGEELPLGAPPGMDSYELKEFPIEVNAEIVNQDSNVMDIKLKLMEMPNKN